jgi:type I restriction enzyme S subunit
MAEQHGKALVPQIRFAGFTDPWEQRKLGDVANVCSGRDYKHLAEGPIPVYGTGGYMTSVSKALSYDEDAIGIGRKGTIDKPYRLQAPFWTVDTLFYAIPEASSDINFLLCSFLNVDWKSKDESTGLPSLSKRAINETEVLVPDNGEQRQIGAFFDRLDSLITLHQRKYDKLCVLKKSMLDKMFPKGGSLYPEIRFAGFTDPWEQRKLSELVEIERGGSPRPIERYITDDPCGLNWVKIGDAPELGRYITQTTEKIKPEGLAKTRQVYPGDLVLSNSMSFGRPYIMAIKGCIHDGWLLIRDAQKHFDPIFLCHMLGAPQMLNQYRMFAAGSTVNNLNKELVGKAIVSLPSKDEQREIGIVLDRLDSLITLHQRKLELLRNIKKSMLDKMFV